jgi:hypothetical protein
MTTLLSTDFSSGTLDSHLTLNVKVAPYTNWWDNTQAFLDTTNHWLVLDPQQGVNHSGNVKISGLGLLNGFTLSLTAHMNIEVLEIVFNRVDANNYWFLQFHDNWWKLYHVIGGVLGTERSNVYQSSHALNGNLTLTVNPTTINATYAGTTIIDNITFDDTLSNSDIGIIGGGSNTTQTCYIDDLLVRDIPVPASASLKSVICVKNYLSTTLKSVIDVKPIISTTLLNKIHVIATLTNTLTVQGNVLGDSPEKPAQIDKLIFMTVNDVVFPNMTTFSVETRGNDQNTTFTITYVSADDLLLFTGQIIRIIELHGDPDGFFTGIIQNIKEDDKTGQRVWTITGRNTGNPLVTQPFALDAVITDPTSFTSEECLNMILFDTRVEIGTCVDIHIDSIMNQNDVYNGWAGNWNTKSEALTALLALISKLKNKNISWFLDTKGLLQIFYTQDTDPSIGISITKGNPRLLSTSIEEDAQSIINSQRGSGGANNTIATKLQDLDSINGWTDEDTGLTWPGYGFMPGAPLQDSSITNLTDLNSAVQNVLDLHSRPIFTVTFTFTRLPDVMIGQPVYLVDHYKFKGMTFVITSITLTGNNAQRYTTIVATTDQTILGPLSEYEAIKSVVTQGITEFVPFWGTVTDKGLGNLTVQPVNKIAAINTKNLGQ